MGVRTEITREKLSKIMKSEKNPNKRPEVRKKISDANKRPGHGKAIKVLVNGNAYGCIKDAVQKENITAYLIHKSIKNKVDGFKFIQKLEEEKCQ